MPDNKDTINQEHLETKPETGAGEHPQALASKPDHKRPGGRKWLILLLALLVVVGGYFLYTQVIAKDDTAARQAAIEEALVANSDNTMDTFRVTVDPNDLAVTEGLDPEWMNILLLGTDTRKGMLNEGRSDALLILSVNKTTGEMKLASLVRDMLVEIPGASRADKIGHANAYGGPLLTIKTVNTLFGLNIRHYCSVNFQGFVDAVNILGGVDVVLTPAEANRMRLEYQEGPIHLNGAKSLHYVRIRALDNNFGRNERQRKFLAALMDKAKKGDRGLIMDAMTQALAMTTTNLSAAQLMELIPVALSSTTDIKMISLPEYGYFTTGRASNGNNGVIIKKEKTVDAFHRFLYGEQTPKASPEKTD